MLLYEFDEPRAQERQDVIDELAATILQNCKPYLALTNALSTPVPHWLYRGMSEPPITRMGVGLLFPHNVRQDRKPRDTPPMIHKMIDDWLAKRFGWHPRSGGLFCSASPSSAQDFGTPCVIFPTGKFDYLWSENIVDMTSQVYGIVGIQSRSDMLAMNYTPWQQKINDRLEAGGWHYNEDFDLYMSTFTQYEMTLNCQSYYAVPFSVGTIRGIGIKDVYTAMKSMI